ncbi:MAG TPA: hypothetical protein VFH38_12460 [Jatrophihabitans sp.]|nr:hypothetical protein [Jatrophihabitans sp.]
MARSKPERLWIGAGAVGVVIVAAVGWGFAVSPKLSQADNLRTQTADTQLQNLSLENHVGQLRADYAKLDQLKKLRDEARLALPNDSGLAQLTKQLNAQGRAAHVSVTLISAGTPAQPTSATTPTTSTDTTASSSSDTSSAAPAPATSSAPAGGLYAIPINLSVTGARDNDLRFLDLVQHQGPRAALVDSVQLSDSGATATGGGATTTTMTVTMNVFVEAVPSAPVVPTPTPTTTAVAAAN